MCSSDLQEITRLQNQLNQQSAAAAAAQAQAVSITMNDENIDLGKSTII